MNIQKYLLPAMIAATVHVALFRLTSDGTRIVPPGIVEIPLDAPPSRPDDEVTPPEEPETSTVPVKPLAGAPSPTSLPEPLTKPKPGDLIVPLAETPKNTTKTLVSIPEITGPGGIGSRGEVGVPGIFTPGELDRMPNAKVQIPPEYPYAMKQSGAGGSVTVEFDVDATGRVVRAEAVTYTNHEFVEPAVRAVKKWRFEPGRRNGKAVPFRLAVPIEFGIETN